MFPLLLLLPLLLLIHLLTNHFSPNLSHIPGPFLASFTNLYRLIIVSYRRPEQWHIALHARYGPYVRIGPTTVICADYAGVKKIYGVGGGFVKVRK
jgi:hypothetical protein